MILMNVSSLIKVGIPNSIGTVFLKRYGKGRSTMKSRKSYFRGGNKNW